MYVNFPEKNIYFSSILLNARFKCFSNERIKLSSTYSLACRLHAYVVPPRFINIWNMYDERFQHGFVRRFIWCVRRFRFSLYTILTGYSSTGLWIVWVRCTHTMTAHVYRSNGKRITEDWVLCVLQKYVCSRLWVKRIGRNLFKYLYIVYYTVDTIIPVFLYKSLKTSQTMGIIASLFQLCVTFWM